MPNKTIDKFRPKNMDEQKTRRSNRRNQTVINSALTLSELPFLEEGIPALVP
jgi:hypothetical protein